MSERLVDCEHVQWLLGKRTDFRVELNLHSAIALLCLPLTRVIHQDLTHDSCRQGKEVLAIENLVRRILGEPKISLMYQRCRLPRGSVAPGAGGCAPAGAARHRQTEPAT